MTDASSKVPYLQAYGNIKKALERIQKASTPTKFTQDFLATKLDLSGGGARPVIAYLKRAEFLSSDGTPTEIYKQFKNPSVSGAAAAQAVRKAYASLYEINEYIHDAKDKELKGAILQVTGLDEDSKLVGAMVGSFKTLRAFANFDEDSSKLNAVDDAEDVNAGRPADQGTLSAANLRLGYTINLNLPPTTDIAVFNAIFKSLREHLL